MKSLLVVAAMACFLPASQAGTIDIKGRATTDSAYGILDLLTFDLSRAGIDPSNLYTWDGGLIGDPAVLSSAIGFQSITVETGLAALTQGIRNLVFLSGPSW